MVSDAYTTPRSGLHEFVTATLPDLRVVVLGMHRSGTSVLVRVLESIGLFSGEESDFHPPTDHDIDGHREHILVWRANELALQSVGRAWDEPVGVDWDLLDTTAGQKVSAAICLALDALEPRSPWVLKDPRLCLTLPLWRRFINPICVMSHRNPLEVAASLAARDDTPLNVGLALWEWYQRKALVSSAGLPRIFTSFASLSASPEHFIDRLTDELLAHAPDVTLPSQRPRPELFVKAQVRHRSTTHDVIQWLNSAQRELFDALEGAADGASDADYAIAAVTMAPMSPQATEVLQAFADQRRRELDITQAPQ